MCPANKSRLMMTPPPKSVISEPPSPLSTTLPPPPPATVKVSMKADVLTVMEVSAAPPRIEPIVEDVTVPEEEAEDACQQETSVTSTGFVSFSVAFAPMG